MHLKRKNVMLVRIYSINKNHHASNTYSYTSEAWSIIIILFKHLKTQ